MEENDQGIETIHFEDEGEWCVDLNLDEDERLSLVVSNSFTETNFLTQMFWKRNWK